MSKGKFSELRGAMSLEAQMLSREKQEALSAELAASALRACEPMDSIQSVVQASDPIFEITELLAVHREAIHTIVRKYQARCPRILCSEGGNVRSGQDSPTLLVEPTSEMVLRDLDSIGDELKSLLGVEVSVLTPNDLPSEDRDALLCLAVSV